MAAQNVIRKAHRFTGTAKASGRRALARIKSSAPLPAVNKRVKEVNKEEWVKARKEKFLAAVEWAGAAKAYRTSLHITQTQLGNAYGGVSSATVCTWESGHYFAWDRASFAEWCDLCNEIANVMKARKES